MGQYYIVVNLDKKEYIDPHGFDDGVKLCEFGRSQDGTMFALALLLANSNGRGGGDAEKNPLIGTWAGDRIVIAGDYGDESDQYIIDGESLSVYHFAHKTFTNITYKILGAVQDNLDSRLK